MKKFSNQLSYEITEDGYDIYLDGVKWICQHEPYIPDPTLTYEENALRQCEELDAGVNPEKILARKKEEKIQLTHDELEKFLADSYVEVNVKGVLQQYSVTKEKQNLLAVLIQRKQYCESNDIDFDAMWNTRGGKAECYTLDELEQVSIAIYAYVQPFTIKQQEFEERIKDCNTLEELDAINISYKEEQETESE